MSEVTKENEEMYEPKGRKLQREIKIKLQPKEFIEVGKQAGEIKLEVIDAETKMDEKKKDVKEYKDFIAIKEGNITELLEQLQTGRKKVLTEVIEVKCTEEQMVKYYHDGKVVDERPMEGDDYQMEMAMDEDNSNVTELNPEAAVFQNEGEQNDTETESDNVDESAESSAEQSTDAPVGE